MKISKILGVISRLRTIRSILFFEKHISVPHTSLLDIWFDCLELSRKCPSYYIIVTSKPCTTFDRGIEWSIENDASRKISAPSRNLCILNKSLGISDTL